MTITLQALGLVTALGRGKADNLRRLLASERSLEHKVLLTEGSVVPVGMVTAPLVPVPGKLAALESRNLALALTALAEIDADIQSAISHFGPDRIAVVAGSSTSGIEAGLEALEAAPAPAPLPVDFDFAKQEMGSVSESIALFFELEGPTMTVSTACSSGAKALASARRLLNQNQADAIIVGGVDSFARMTLNGFHSLLALDDEACRPFDVSRNGISIGEGAAFFLMVRGTGPVCLSGIGESADAFNMTAPAPDGRGAMLAMTRALADAKQTPADIDYINLHGTGTPLNDAMEASAVHTVFGAATPCSGSKGQIGHTLGACGAIEAAYCWLILSAQTETGRVLPHVGCSTVDPEFPPLALVRGETNIGSPVRSVLSSSYAFGGSNVTVILSGSELGEQR